jgi:protein phosphatase inhibitor 2
MMDESATAGDLPPPLADHSTGSNTPNDPDGHPVKPALKHGNNNKKKKAKGGLKWDEAKIEEHDKLRGTRMKIEEPNTPYHHDYESGSETDGSHTGHKDKDLSWDHLENKLAGVAAARDAYPSSPSSHGGDDNLTDEQREKEIKAIEFQEHRKRHYNEMELVRKFRQEHSDEPDDDENDADDET